MTNDELIESARARLDEHGDSSQVMKEIRALLEKIDEVPPSTGTGPGAYARSLKNSGLKNHDDHGSADH